MLYPPLKKKQKTTQSLIIPCIPQVIQLLLQPYQDSIMKGTWSSGLPAFVGRKEMMK